MPTVYGFGLTENEFDLLGEMAGDVPRHEFVKQLVLQAIREEEVRRNAGN